MAQVEMTDRVSGINQKVETVPGKTITVSAQDATKIIADRGDIKNMLREGDDLLIILSDGSQIRVDEYFSCEPTQRDDLSVQEPGGAIWVVNFDDDVCAADDGSVAWSYVPLASSAAEQAVSGTVVPDSVSATDTTPASHGSGTSAPVLIGLGALVVGGLAAAAGGGGGSNGVSGQGTGDGDGNADTTAPAAPVIDPTNGTVISGTAEAGSTVSLDLDGDGTTDATTVADDGGTFSYTPGEPLEDGTEVTATATDEAGNESDPSSVIVDASTDTPVIDEVIDDVLALTGLVADGNATNDALPQIKGSGAEAGATIEISDGQTVLGTTAANADGNWTFAIASPLDDGQHQFTARATDQLGNVSGQSAVYSIIVDTIAPDAPVLNPTDGDTVTGTAEANSSVAIDLDDDGTADATVTAGSNGVFTYTPGGPLTDGTLVSATASDAAGNTSAEGSIVVDDGGGTTTPPQAPAITSVVDDAAPVLGTIADGGVTNDARPTISGTAEAGASVRIFDGSTQIGTTTANSGGTWSFTPPTAIGEGNHAFTAKATNAGGTSPASADYSIIVDTIAPDAPVLNPTDGDTVTGTAEANSSVAIDLDDDGTTDATVTAGSNGVFTYTPGGPLTDGTLVSATASDAAGNMSAEGSVTVDDGGNGGGDGNPPPAPTITSIIDDVGAMTGPVADGGLTDDTLPTLEGSAQAGATVTIFDGAAQIGEVVANGSGAWTFTPGSSLADGAHAFTATATDVDGTSGASSAYDIIVDTGGGAPTEDIEITAIAEDTPPVGDFQTEDLSPVVSGTLSAALGSGEFVEVRVDGGAWAMANVSGSTWSYDLGVLSEATHTVDARVINNADLVGDIDTEQVVIIDTDHAPIVQATEGSLLGLISADVLNLINFSGQDLFAFDADNDLASVSIAYEPLVSLNLGSFTLSVDESLASSLGIQVTIENDPGLLTIVAPSSILTITAMGGGTLDNVDVNQVLATVQYEQDILGLGLGTAADVLDATTISATDVTGLSDSQVVGDLIDASLLNGVSLFG